MLGCLNHILNDSRALEMLASRAVSFQKRFGGLQLSCFSPKFAHAPQAQFSCFSGQHSHAFEVEFSCFSCFSLADLSSFVGTVDTFYHCLADTAQSWEPFPLSTSSSGFEHLLKQTKICFDIYFILKHVLPCDAYSGIFRYLCWCTLRLGESSKETITMQLQKKIFNSRVNISCSTKGQGHSHHRMIHQSPDQSDYFTNHQNVSPHTKTFHSTPE